MNIACDVGIFRPESLGRPAKIVNTHARVIAPREFAGGLPVMERAVIFMAAFDQEADIWTVSRYPDTGDGITFEASSIENAFERAATIVPDIFEARGLPANAIGVIIDEYDSPAVFED